MVPGKEGGFSTFEPGGAPEFIYDVSMAHQKAGTPLVQIDPSQHADFAAEDLEVHSAFLVYRNRLEREENIFAGQRVDILRRTEDGLQVARRVILLDQNVLQAKNISTFF